MARRSKPAPFIACTPKELPEHQLVAAAADAIAINPANAPYAEGMAQLLTALAMPSNAVVDIGRLAVITTKYWQVSGIDLTVGFMETIQADLRERLMSHMNAVGGSHANIKFRWTQTSPQVRITRSGDGYWSYLGTDVLSIPRNQPTMCLQGFTMSTSEAEYKRVVRHETGHTCGCPHEHLRSAIVSRLDPAKTIAYFARMGWSEAQTRSNVLTPLEDRLLTATVTTDEDSFMAYQLPGSITKDGRPIVGGSDLTANDRAFLAKIHPLAVAPPPPPGGETMEAAVKYKGKVLRGTLTEAAS